MTGSGAALAVLLGACVPGGLAVRHAMRRALPAPPPLRLRVVHGGADAKPHAA